MNVRKIHITKIDQIVKFVQNFHAGG